MIACDNCGKATSRVATTAAMLALAVTEFGMFIELCPTCVRAYRAGYEAHKALEKAGA